MKEVKDYAKISKNLSKLIRIKLTNQEFWEYYNSWKDIEEAATEMENWDTETKRIAINQILDMFPRLKNKKITEAIENGQIKNGT